LQHLRLSGQNNENQKWNVDMIQPRLVRNIALELNALVHVANIQIHNHRHCAIRMEPPGQDIEFGKHLKSIQNLNGGGKNSLARCL